MNNATAMAIHHLALKSSLPNWASQLNLFNVALRESIILRNLIQFNKYLKTSLHCYIALSPFSSRGIKTIKSDTDKFIHLWFLFFSRSVTLTVDLKLSF